MIQPGNLYYKIKAAAEKHGIDPTIVYGVVQQESTGNSIACRFEKNYKWLYKPGSVKPRSCSLDTEVASQKMSWGLMQVMGAVYRELGYKDWLSKVLTLPELQLDYGCKFLKKKIDKYGLHEGILCYNSGSPLFNDDGSYKNQYYLDKVLHYSKGFYQLKT